ADIGFIDFKVAGASHCPPTDIANERQGVVERSHRNGQFARTYTPLTCERVVNDAPGHLLVDNCFIKPPPAMLGDLQVCRKINGYAFVSGRTQLRTDLELDVGIDV